MVCLTQLRPPRATQEHRGGSCRPQRQRTWLYVAAQQQEPPPPPRWGRAATSPRLSASHPTRAAWHIPGDPSSPLLLKPSHVQQPRTPSPPLRGLCEAAAGRGRGRRRLPPPRRLPPLQRQRLRGLPCLRRRWAPGARGVPETHPPQLGPFTGWVGCAGRGVGRGVGRCGGGVWRGGRSTVGVTSGWGRLWWCLWPSWKAGWGPWGQCGLWGQGGHSWAGWGPCGQWGQWHAEIALPKVVAAAPRGWGRVTGRQSVPDPHPTPTHPPHPTALPHPCPPLQP